jgi:hypothetical protein
MLCDQGSMKADSLQLARSDFSLGSYPRDNPSPRVPVPRHVRSSNDRKGDRFIHHFASPPTQTYPTSHVDLQVFLTHDQQFGQDQHFTGCLDDIYKVMRAPLLLFAAIDS